METILTRISPGENTTEGPTGARIAKLAQRPNDVLIFDPQQTIPAKPLIMNGAQIDQIMQQDERLFSYDDSDTYFINPDTALVEITTESGTKFYIHSGYLIDASGKDGRNLYCKLPDNFALKVGEPIVIPGVIKTSNIKSFVFATDYHIEVDNRTLPQHGLLDPETFHEIGLSISRRSNDEQFVGYTNGRKLGDPDFAKKLEGVGSRVIHDTLNTQGDPTRTNTALIETASGSKYVLMDGYLVDLEKHTAEKLLPGTDSVLEVGRQAQVTLESRPWHSSQVVGITVPLGKATAPGERYLAEPTVNPFDQARSIIHDMTQSFGRTA